MEFKEDESPVTQADRGAEELMRAMIAKKFRSHGIKGEEFGDVNPDAEFTWVLDPIDGTKAFASACPLFGTLIALMYQASRCSERSISPVLRQLVIGDGRTTTLNGRAVRLRSVRARIEDATLLTSDPLNPAKYQNGPAFAAVADRARLVRTWGDCYGYLLLATGWVDADVRPPS